MMNLFRIDIETEFDEAFNYYHSYTGCSFEFDTETLIINLGGDKEHAILYDYKIIKYLRIDKEEG